MRDAFGGVMNVFMMSVFLAIVVSILAFIVSYSKAFRMKNSIISYIERYEGSISCTTSGSTCSDKIVEYAKKVAYAPTELRCPTDTDGEYEKFPEANNGKALFCYKIKDSDSGNNKIYVIVTQVDIDLPILNKMAGLSFFQVRGETRAISK